MLSEVEAGWSPLREGCASNRRNWQNLADEPAHSDVTSSTNVTSPASSTNASSAHKSQPSACNLNNGDSHRSADSPPLRKISNNSVKNLSQNNLQKQNNTDLDKLRKISNQSIRNETHVTLVGDAHLQSGKKRDVIAPPSPTQLSQLRADAEARNRKSRSATCAIL